MINSTSFSTKESVQKLAQNAGNDATVTFDTTLLNGVMRTMRDSLNKSVDNLTTNMVTGYALSELELALNAEYHRLKKVLKKQFHPSPEARKELIARFDSECGMLRSIMVEKYFSVKQSSLDWAVSRAVNAIDHELHEVDVDTLVPSPTLANALEEKISNKARTVKHRIIQSVAGWLLSEQDKQDDQDSDEANPEVAAQLLQENQFHVSLEKSTADRASAYRATLSAAVSAREDNLVAGSAVTISASSAAEQRARAAEWAAANLASKDNKAKRTNRREATPPRKSVPQQRADAVAFAKSHYGEEAVALTPPAFYFKRKPMTEERANRLNEAKEEVRRQAAERRSAAAIAAAERAAKTKASLRSSAPQPAPPTTVPQISKSTSERKFIDDCGKQHVSSEVIRVQSDVPAKEETPVGQELQARRRLKVPATTRSKRASSSEVLPLPPFVNIFSKPALHAPINEPVSAPVVPGEGDSLPRVDASLLEKLLSGQHTSPSSSSSSSAKGPASLDSCLARTANLKGVSCKMEPAPPLPPSHESVAHDVCDPTPDGEAVDGTFSDQEEEDEVDTPNRPMAAFMPNFAPQLSVDNAAEAARVAEKRSEEQRIQDKIVAEKRAVLEKERQLQEELEREAQRLQDIADRIAAEARAEREKEQRLAEKLAADIRAEEEEEEEAAVRGAEEAARRAVQDAIDAELAAKQVIEEKKIRAVQREREAAEAAVREAQEAEERAIAEAAAEAARLVAEEEERIKNEREEKERREEEAHQEVLRIAAEQAAAEKKTIGETGQSDRSPPEEVRAPRGTSSPSDQSDPRGPHDHTHGRESESVIQDAVSPKSVSVMEDDTCDPPAAVDAEEGSKPVKRRSWFKSIFRWKSKKEKKSKP